MTLKLVFAAIASTAVLITTGLRRYRRGNAKRAFTGCPLDQFAKIQSSTHCPYAKNARLQTVTESAGTEALYLLIKSCVTALPATVDGVVLELDQRCDTEAELHESASDVIRNVCKLNVDRNPQDSRYSCLLYTSPSPRDRTRSRMPSSA
eukprot:TRINITY_DN16299_c0_g1_i3.p1 TRINITY_DN16299_c0_g1~~TRINITY_DN16299_c0_g1_i3.p1  ORF type:complete len:150 (-),score=14.57 TRINITY_DN16299_c0_g1_i3:82-531(-)